VEVGGWNDTLVSENEYLVGGTLHMLMTMFNDRVEKKSFEE
jgi:hypothetical protein